VDAERPRDQAEHTAVTRAAYDRLAPAWSSTTDAGPFNGLLERPALRSMVPRPLGGRTVLDAGCGSGAQCEWLLAHGADVVGVDLSPAMVEEARRRCGDRGRFMVADLSEPLDLEPASVDGITCSLVLHYLLDWEVALGSFASVLRPGGWAVISLDHPFRPPLPDRRGGYFDTELVSDTWSKGQVRVTQHFWHRPLSAVVDAFARAGFSVEGVGEAQPSARALRQFPDELGEVVGVPSFIVYRIRAAGSGDRQSGPRRRRSPG
jgi:SAM-dependent methyltransferase